MAENKIIRTFDTAFSVDNIVCRIPISARYRLSGGKLTAVEYVCTDVPVGWLAKYLADRLGIDLERSVS